MIAVLVRTAVYINSEEDAGEDGSDVPYMRVRAMSRRLRNLSRPNPFTMTYPVGPVGPGLHTENQVTCLYASQAKIRSNG